MDEPIDYGKVAKHLKRTRGLPSVEITTPYQSNWLDNAKAKFLLDWRPKIDLKQLVDKAWSYNRTDDDPRKIWYPG
jgi:nucleoside-diphosphate-sugar epimerase